VNSGTCSCVRKRTPFYSFLFYGSNYGTCFSHSVDGQCVGTYKFPGAFAVLLELGTANLLNLRFPLDYNRFRDQKCSIKHFFLTVYSTVFNDLLVSLGNPLELFHLVTLTPKHHHLNLDLSTSVL